MLETFNYQTFYLKASLDAQEDVSNSTSISGVLSPIIEIVNGFKETQDEEIQGVLSNSSRQIGEHLYKMLGEDFSQIETIGRKKNIIQIFMKDGGIYCYNIFEVGTEKLFLGEYNEIIRESLFKWGNFQDYIKAMQAIFQENDGVFGGGRLDKNDIFTPTMITGLTDPSLASSLEGKSIKEVQIEARQSYQEILKQIEKVPLDFMPPDIKIAFLEAIDTYTRMTMGIGDVNEGGATLFDKSMEEVKYGFIINIEERPSSPEVFEYYKNIREEMFSNTHQDSVVEDKSYPLSIKILNSTIFDVLKKRNASDAEFLEFSRMVSGRGIDYYTGGIPANGPGDDPNMANDILIYIMGREGGLIPKLLEQKLIEVEDPTITRLYPDFQTTGQIISATSMKIETAINSGEGERINGFDFISSSFPDISVEIFKFPYSELSLAQKIQVSSVVRFAEKIKDYRWQKDMNSEYGWYFTEHSQTNGSPEFTDNLFATISQECLKDSISDITEAIGSFSDWSWNGKKPLDSGDLRSSLGEDGKRIFSETDIQIFETFNDINGFGDSIFEISDTHVDWSITGIKIAALIAASMLLTAGTASLVGIYASTALKAGTISRNTAAGLNAFRRGMQGRNLLIEGGITSFYSSPASWVVFPKGYSSNEELWTDILSDLTVATITGVAGGYIARAWGQEGAKFLSAGNFKNKLIFAGDIGFLGLYTESLRMRAIDNIYHSGNFLTDDNPGNLYYTEPSVGPR